MHFNRPYCPGCQEKFNQYQGFSISLRLWFEELQKKYPDFHISCAWRNKVDQEYLFQKGATKSRYGASPHNWGAAIDLYHNVKGDLYPKDKFDEIAKDLPDYILWYGREGAPFYELPHFEIKDWFKLTKINSLRLIE